MSLALKLSCRKHKVYLLSNLASLLTHYLSSNCNLVNYFSVPKVNYFLYLYLFYLQVIFFLTSLKYKTNISLCTYEFFFCFIFSSYRCKTLSKALVNSSRGVATCQTSILEAPGKTCIWSSTRIYCYSHFYLTYFCAVYPR